MTAEEEALASAAQTMLRLRSKPKAIGRDEIAAMVDECAHLLPNGLTAESRKRVITELETRIVVKVGRSTRIVDEHGHVPWYAGGRKDDRRFFRRYADFLAQVEGWPQAAIDGLDESTDAIMEELEDPEREGPWDRRGLVVGHVQSGKTANYAGLVNKSVDAGYKLIIILAGMHNALRQQTQRRMDRDFLGYLTTASRNGAYTRIGVGIIDVSLQAEHLTTQANNGDFNRAVADHVGMGVQQRPVLLVIKKNARILENLNKWVQEALVPRGDTQTRPMLVIDDEADQASVDTGEQQFDEDDVPDPDYEPKRINGQIRQLLSAFQRSAYVAYTATPFANILIHDAATATDFGDDLFPRSFILNLPTPSNYMGPELVFGIDSDEGEASALPLPLVRHVDQEGEGWIAEEHKKTFVPSYEGERKIPPSLEDAILSFILICAARAARGQERAHNSMLVHVSRFKDVHQHVFSQIDDWITLQKRQLKFGGDSPLIVRLQRLWERDFVPTSGDIRGRRDGRDLLVTGWSDIKERLSTAANKITARVVNSDTREPIDYEAHAATGLSMIAIGGDKLSRGLTLEGLSVSYFLRASRMYDSLMQMGRWFGYRPGYLDLCRLYLTEDLELWFRHVATAAEELRGRLNHMAMIGATPEQYGLRIQSHDILLVTAPNKMRNSREFQVSFEGEGKIQTVFFSDEGVNRGNADRIVALLSQLPPPEVNPVRERPQRRRHTWLNSRVWTRVGGSEVAGLLASVQFPEEARDVNGDRLADYIRLQVPGGELTEWTVAVMAGEGEVLTYGGMEFHTLERAPLAGVKRPGRYVVKTILAPRDEAIDLDERGYGEAVELSNKKREAKGRNPGDAPDGPEIRRVRGHDPRHGLLLMYPLSPRAAHLDYQTPIFGFVISFPDSGNGRSVRYRFGAVAQRLERV